MIASLLAASLLVAEPPAPHVAEDGQRSGRVHLQLDGAGTWGIGGQMFLGTNLRFAALLEHWTTSKALGTWDLGAVFAYQNEPTFLAPWIDPTQVDGAGHRLVLAAHVGHTVHMGARRRVALGLSASAGLNHWRSSYSVSYADEDVSGSAVVSRNLAVVGGELRLGYRFHRRVGAQLVLGAPAPTTTSYAISVAHVGLGLSVHLR